MRRKCVNRSDTCSNFLVTLWSRTLGHSNRCDTLTGCQWVIWCVSLCGFHDFFSLSFFSGVDTSSLLIHYSKSFDQSWEL